jgi:hypothetical protein
MLLQKMDHTNPEHVRALVEMREHTNALEQGRGIWARRGAPGVERDWTDDVAAKETTTKAPLENPDYAEYIKYACFDLYHAMNITDSLLRSGIAKGETPPRRLAPETETTTVSKTHAPPRV